jgi:hypothetical protein
MTTAVLESLVGEGKKFQSVEQLAEAKLQSDQYIEKLKGDLAAVQAQAGSGNAEALDRILAEIKNNQSVTTQTTTSSDTSNQSGAALTEDKIVAIIERREKQRVATQNTETAMAQVRKVHGSKSEEFLAKLATETGTSVDELKAIAARSPAMFLKVADLDRTTQGTQTSTSSVNSQALKTSVNSDGSVRDKTFYDAKMKEMGSKKFVFDSALQVQMHEDMKRLGDAWSAD